MGWVAEKAVDLASNSATQMLTLTVAILALTAASDFVKSAEGRAPRRLLAAAWIFFVISFLAGTMFLLSLTGAMDLSLEPGEETGYFQSDPYRITLPSGEVGLFTPEARYLSLSRTEFIHEPTIWEPNLRTLIGIQTFSFLIGTSLTSCLVLASFLKKPRRQLAIGRISRHTRRPTVAKLRRHHPGNGLTLV